MNLIDGKAIAARINEESRESVIRIKGHGVTPGLAVVLVGDHPASIIYVRNKDRTSQELGLYSRRVQLPGTTSQAELLRLVEELNQDQQVHGILVQSPLPPQIDEPTVVRRIDPLKDVDGFHPLNVGKLAMGDPTALVPCTPRGCQRLLLESNIRISGAHVVVVGRSMIVGKPLALLLMQKGPGGDATVTVAHSRTRDLPGITRQADILVAAIGQAQFIRAEHVREGATVIDVGINRMNDPSKPGGSRLAGDVAFEEVAEKAGAITP
ncbi:MAG: bifunctional 5,10-methylene-tetrahydrofolate dehydrogenase/5,10-methylene-tetrahydrofolate cyclohydrolase, partial [Verrucomicrobia bacterium]|nr:bifunctional 5,10-methylene-tetrahydrofolate dehydrogenase/5,10-methylene-tetrahydrofolate cyclohydrolase [Verrucomicrobiota bacterium]